MPVVSRSRFVSASSSSSFSFPVAALCLLLVLLAPAAAARADMGRRIRAVLGEKYLKDAQVGVAVARLGVPGDDGPEVLFSHNAAKPLIPASNLKLVTTAAALDRLGADFRFRTLLLLGGEGDLYLIGDGDPTLGDVEMLGAFGWDVKTAFRQWAEMLKGRGITSVRNVVIDDSVFDQTFIHPNWPMDQAHLRYVAQVGGINLNANCIDFYLTTGARGQVVSYATNPDTRYIDLRNTCTTGDRNAVWLSRELGTNNVVLRGETDASNTSPIRVTIDDPPMFAGTVLAETLREAGVEVTGEVTRDLTARQAYLRAGAGGGWTPVAALETQLSQVLARSNKDSMNLYAEALCKRLGHQMTGEPGSWANGTAAIAAFLESCGVPASQFALDDGCGLSRNNTISADAVVRVLTRMYNRDDGQAFFSSLAVSGFDGTLEDRFRNSDLQGRVFAKSGYINRVSALSGYVRGGDGVWYAFAILMNDIPHMTNGTAKQIQERIVRAIDESVSEAQLGG